MDSVWEPLATQIPVAVLFAVFALILTVYFMRFIKEQRKEFLEAISTMLSKLDNLAGKIEDLEKTIDKKRRI